MKKHRSTISLILLSSMVVTTYVMAATQLFFRDILPLMYGIVPYMISAAISINVYLIVRSKKEVGKIECSIIAGCASMTGYFYQYSSIVLYNNAALGFEPILEYQWERLLKNVFGMDLLEHLPIMLFTAGCVIEICLLGDLIIKHINRLFHILLFALRDIVSGSKTNLHVIKLDEKTFDMIKNKRKTFDCSIYSYKASLFKPGDTIIIKSYKGRKLACRIISIHRYSSFEELFKHHNSHCFGIEMTYTEAVSQMTKKYANSHETIQRYGVIAIEWKVCLYDKCFVNMIDEKAKR